MTEVPLPTSETRSDDVDIVNQSLESLRIIENAPLGIDDEGGLDVSGEQLDVGLSEPLDASGGVIGVTPDGDFVVVRSTEWADDHTEMISLLTDIEENTRP